MATKCHPGGAEPLQILQAARHTTFTAQHNSHSESNHDTLFLQAAAAAAGKINDTGTDPSDHRVIVGLAPARLDPVVNLAAKAEISLMVARSSGLRASSLLTISAACKAAHLFSLTPRELIEHMRIMVIHPRCKNLVRNISLVICHSIARD